MSWNNAHEKHKLEKLLKKQEEEYRSLGMSEFQIQAILEYDRMEYRSKRRFYTHNQLLTFENVDTENDFESSLPIPILSKLTATMDTYGEYSRHWWVEEITDTELSIALKQLTAEELELLTMIVFDGYKQDEIGKIIGVSQSAISQRISTLKKKLKNFKKF